MIDYHIHPDFSPDAKGSLLDYCQVARKLGMKEICFTTHYEPDPERAEIEQVIVKDKRVPVDSDWVEDYFGEIDRCRKQFSDLTIRAGVEIGYEMGLEGKIANFLARYQFDFVLGAVHCLDHIAITASKELKEFHNKLKPRGGNYIARRYFEYIRAAARSHLFDAIAHLDIWRKYIIGEMDEGFARAIDELIEPMLIEIARSGVGIEVNTAPLRNNEEAEPYPTKRIIQQAVKLGIRTFTVGSDAHQPHHLGLGIPKAIQLLGEFGLKPTRFKNRQVIT
ncbi:MAG: histidinol-phosphatase [candidate division WOR-3 bacterium]